MRWAAIAILAIAAFGTVLGRRVRADSPTLEAGWQQPPMENRLRAYWWWLNGNVDEAAITRDLEEMRAKGFGGALICDAGGAEQGGNDDVPAGPTFFSPAWRKLYRHALVEADRLGLELSLNIQSGWNVGGPPVATEDAVKQLVWSETDVRGPGKFESALAAPEARDGFYRDQFVVAYPLKDKPTRHRPLAHGKAKSLEAALRFPGENGWFLANSSPDTSALLEDWPAMPGEEDALAKDVVDLTEHMDAGGKLTWDAPPGHWAVLRFGYTHADNCRVSTHSAGWDGYALDVLDEAAFRRYWDAVVEPLIADAGPMAGKTLKYLHTDSWEIDVFNWTPALPQEIKKRRGYDLRPYLPVLAGRIVGSREISNRFLDDFRKTIGDMAVDRHYRVFSELAAERGLGIHPESGGPHFTPIDAQRCLGIDDVPMSEFWADSATHRNQDNVRFFVKQPASAAHVNGRQFVAAEGFTTVGPHWQETLWDNLKPSFDYAATEGLNRLFWHAFVCSPASMGVPGQQYFAGTHLNPLVTWWSRSAPFFSYINRCQWMLSQGRFVADACYYYGDHVPNFAQLRASDPARLGRGYDYDVIDEHAILARLSCRDGKLVLPDGMQYRMLVLPPQHAISLPVLRKVRELVDAGATVVGPRPEAASGLAGYPKSDKEVARIAEELWRSDRSGPGRVVGDKTALDVLRQDGVEPDFELVGDDADADVRWIHRRTDDADIYFVANRARQPASIEAAFRVAERAPEIWDPVSGRRQFTARYRTEDGTTTVALDLPPCGSAFVVFRSPASEHPPADGSHRESFETVAEVKGPWTVRFAPQWGGPRSVEFKDLASWTDNADSAIRYYSGTATYATEFTAPATMTGDTVFLNLGGVRELAEVRLNGQSLGVVWAPPFRVDVTAAMKPGINRLEVDVVNFWANRLIGDQSLAPGDRFGRTNVRMNKAAKLMDSGLLGPVVLEIGR